MDYQTCLLRNLSYLQNNFPKRNVLKFRRHPLKAMYLFEKVEQMLDYFVEVYYVIASEEFTPLDFVRLVEQSYDKILNVSRVLYSNDLDTLSFFQTSQLKIMIEGFYYVVRTTIKDKKYHA